MITRRSVLILVCVLLTGCGFLRRPQNTFYSLDTLPPQGPVRTVGGVAIGIDGLELPPGLDRRGIVLRGPDHKVEVRGTHQWTASLEEMVTHTLAFDLAGRLPNGMVILPGQAKPAAMRSLYLTFEDLAPGPDGNFILDARWTLTEAGRRDLTGHERVTIPLASKESASIVAAMSQAVATLADRIVAALPA